MQSTSAAALAPQGNVNDHLWSSGYYMQNSTTNDTHYTKISHGWSPAYDAGTTTSSTTDDTHYIESSHVWSPAYDADTITSSTYSEVSVKTSGLHIPHIYEVIDEWGSSTTDDTHCLDDIPYDIPLPSLYYYYALSNAKIADSEIYEQITTSENSGYESPVPILYSIPYVDDTAPLNLVNEIGVNEFNHICW